MKRLNTYLNIFCAAAIALMLVSCGGGKDYRNLLPADSFAVFSINPKSLAHKAKIGDFTKSIYYKMMDQSLGETNMTPDQRAYLLSLAADPANTGLSMDHDCFIFVISEDFQRGDADGGMLFKVKDRKALDKFVGLLEEEGSLEKFSRDGITIVADPDSWNTAILAYDNDAFVFYFSEEDYEDTLPEVVKLFGHKKSESLMDVSHVESTLNGSYDMTLIGSYKAMGDAFPSEFRMLPGMDALADMMVIMPVSFEKGRIVAEAKICFEDKEAEKKYKELAGLNEVQKGDLTKFVPANSVVTVSGALNGAKMYEYFEKVPMFTMALAMAPQAKPILEALNGDIVLSFNKMSSGGRVPEFTALVEVKDPAIMDTVEDFIVNELDADKTSQYNFSGNFYGVQYWLGVKDNVFYATTDNTALALLSGSEDEVSLHETNARLFKGGYGTFLVDFVALRSMLEVLVAERVIGREAAMALPVIGMFENMEVTSSTISEAKMVVNMTDKDKNAAEVIYSMIENVAGTFLGIMF